MDDIREAKSLEKKLNRWAYIVSALVLILVLLMRRYTIPTDIDFSFLPPIHASLNALCASTLIMAFMAIRKKNVELHRKWINLSFVLSILFLLSYVTYHFTTPETKYCGEGAIRYLYFVLLISHIILAGVILPFILLTYIRAYTGQFDRHRKIARWVFPLWLYVAISGPVCYLFLVPCY